MTTPIRITFAGPTYVLTTKDRTWRFEEAAYTKAPILLRENGEPYKRPMSKRNPFWEVYYAWVKEGQQFWEHSDGERYCIWSGMASWVAQMAMFDSGWWDSQSRNADSQKCDKTKKEQDDE